MPKLRYLEELGVSLPKEFVDIAEKRDDTLAGEAAPFLPREVVDYTVLAGDATRCAEQLAGVVRPEVGSITIRPHAAPGESVKDVIRAFAVDVMPRVERLVAERDSNS